MKRLTKQMNIKVAIQALVIFSILVTLCSALHAAEKATEQSKAAPKRTQGVDSIPVVEGASAQLEWRELPELPPTTGFEDGLGAWTSLGGGEVAVSEMAAHTGKKSLLTSGRTKSWWGPHVSLLDIMEKDHTYAVSLWLRLKEPGKHSIRINVSQTDASKHRWKTADAKEITANEWTQLSGVFTLRTIGELTTLFLHINCSEADYDVFVDDVSITHLGKAEGLYAEVGEQVRMEYCPLNTPPNGTKANITITDLDGKEIRSIPCKPGEAVSLDLPDGFYRAQGALVGADNPQPEEAMYVVGDPIPLVKQILLRVPKVRDDPTKRECAGWLDYLHGRLQKRLDELTNQAGEAEKAPQFTVLDIDLAHQLSTWTRRIAENPAVLSELKGIVEWGFLSEADDTGQPFKLVFPPDYDPAHAYALELYVHGSGGTHQQYSEWMTNTVDLFQLSVLGRGRSCGYYALSEVDALDALAYVREHWNIDPDRIRIGGHSMGGGGTFHLASRHPHLFACARPEAGYGNGTPIRNMLHVPLYNLHGLDDWAVPIAMSRPATRRLAEFGGSVIDDECTGFGHSTMGYKEGYKRARLWCAQQTRPAIVRRVHYEATDELARKAYWVEVAEWGPEGRPAVIDANLNPDNSLYITLDNVDVAKIDLAASPANRAAAMMVTVNRNSIHELPAPLPEALFVTRAQEGWQITNKPPEAPPQRLHFPGGAGALYHGEPMLVVWGTGADEEINKRIYDVAQIERHTPRPGWPEWGFLDEGYPRNRMLFGQLLGKPDSEVTAADIAKYNLMLIGTAEQNSVVARIADKLPVQVKDGKVLSNDGFSWSFTDRAVGLLYYNPLAPDRLVYWVASDAPEFYMPNAELMGRQGGDPSPDFMIMDATGWKHVAARRFDSRWSWEPRYGASPKLPKAACLQKGSALMHAKAIRKATGADFTLSDCAWDSREHVFAYRETKVADVIAQEYSGNLGLIELTYAELTEAHNTLTRIEKEARDKAREQLKAAKTKKEREAVDKPRTMRLVPAPRLGKLDPARTYRVALGPGVGWGFANTTRIVPNTFRLLDITMREALERSLETP